MKKVHPILFVFIFLLGMACNRQRQISKDVAMNEAIILTNISVFVDSCWNKGNVKYLDSISTENVTRNLNGIIVATSRKEMEAHMAVFSKAFPDLEVKRDSTYIKDNMAFFNWSSTGTHMGVFGEIAATGKKVRINGLSHLYFTNEGRLYQEDVVYNELELLQQLGYTLNPPVLE